MSHIEQQRKLHAANRLQVMKILGWDELQYGQFQYDQAFVYLRYNGIKAAEWVDALERTKLFWDWWKNHWSMRENWLFLKKENHTEARYRYIHSPEFIQGHPSRHVMEESYAVLVGKTIDNLKADAV